MKNIIIKQSLLGIFCALLVNSCSHLLKKDTATLSPQAKDRVDTPSTLSPGSSSQQDSNDNTPVIEAVKIPDHKELLKKHFPSADRFEEVAFLPAKNVF